MPNFDTNEVSIVEIHRAFERMFDRGIESGCTPLTAIALMRHCSEARYEFEILRQRGLAFDHEEV